jgi:hypothetical protein
LRSTELWKFPLTLSRKYNNYLFTAEHLCTFTLNTKTKNESQYPRSVRRRCHPCPCGCHGRQRLQAEEEQEPFQEDQVQEEPLEEVHEEQEQQEQLQSSASGLLVVELLSFSTKYSDSSVKRGS